MRLVIVFAIILMFTATSLVTVRFNSRELFVTSERLKSQSSELDKEWRRLQLERGELASNTRIDSIARSKLELIPITPDRTIYIQESKLGSSASGVRP